MSESSEEMSEVYRHYLELSTPTEEDLKRVFTEEELKELCLRHKCRVDIWRWNIVDDYRVLFTESGRYQRWSEKDRLRMLAKAVNKIRPDLYNDEVIRKGREERWKFQLKENILSLNFWKRKRAKQAQTVSTESEDIDSEVLSQFEVNTDSINTAELLTASQRQELENTPEINKPAKQVQNEKIPVPKKVGELNSKEVPTQNKPKINAHTALANITESDYEEDYISEQDSEDSLETVMLNDKREESEVEILESDKVASDIENMYGINTLSMTIDSGMSTQSQELRALQSQDVIPPNYDNFKNIIPLTSTQSQSQDTVERLS